MNKKVHDEMQVQNDDNYSYAGIPELWTIEKQLKNYNCDIVTKFSRFFSPNDKVLEYGAGIGTLSQLLTTICNIKPDCLEIDGHLRKVLSERGFNNFSSISHLPQQYDAIYFSNVLEHIENDEQALRDLRLILKDNGKIIIYVPAFMMLFSEFDASVGHYRRYNKRNLSKTIESAGFTVIHYEYVDSIGFFVWLLLKWRNISQKLKHKSEATESHKSFEIYDRFIYPISRKLDAFGFKYLLGKNILMVAKK
jgi:2-polyprenyl-3-methyl-5-hydroxy-6-metoxy-1,4-benzoquinol methylase